MTRLEKINKVVSVIEDENVKTFEEAVFRLAKEGLIDIVNEHIYLLIYLTSEEKSGSCE